MPSSSWHSMTPYKRDSTQRLVAKSWLSCRFHHRHRMAAAIKKTDVHSFGRPTSRTRRKQRRKIWRDKTTISSQIKHCLVSSGIPSSRDGRVFSFWKHGRRQQFLGRKTMRRGCGVLLLNLMLPPYFDCKRRDVSIRLNLPPTLTRTKESIMSHY